MNSTPDKNTWIPRDDLIQMGFEKMVIEVDAKEAAQAGLMAKPLTALNVQKHLEDFGLESEFSTHSLMRGLSGGQKVKVRHAAGSTESIDVHLALGVGGCRQDVPRRLLYKRRRRASFLFYIRTLRLANSHGASKHEK